MFFRSCNPPSVDETSPGVTLAAGQKGNPFRDARVREAIALSLDHVALAREVAGRVATQLVPLADR